MFNFNYLLKFKIMKKTNIYILTMLLLVFNSCSDFLEEDNKVGQTADLTYNTSSGIAGLISSCYSFARGWYGKEAGLGLSEMGSDLFYTGLDNKQKSLTSYNINSISLDNSNVNDNACLDQYWELFYYATDVCNNAIKYVPICKAIDDNLKARYLGEAYFLRAFYYFHMVNIWGPVPYNSVPVTTINTAPTRTSEEVIYSNILADLDNSISSFETANYKIKTDGRANYWAARAFKARVLLYAASWLGATSITSNSNYSGQNLYSLAQAEAQAVIGSDIASFYKTYSDTWSMSNEDIRSNSESIFGISYSSDLTAYSNALPNRYKKDDEGEALAWNGTISRKTTGGSAMLLMFVGLWNNGCDDVKDIFVRCLADPTKLTNSVTKAEVNCTPYYSKYGRGFTRYLPSLYLWKLLDKHRATDQRTEATLLEAYTIAPGLEGSSKKYTNMYDTAIYYCPLDGNSAEGIAKQAWAKNRYRIQFIYNGDIPVYTSSDPATALPTTTAKATSDVYGDTRYNQVKIGGWYSYPCMQKFLDNVYDGTYCTYDISYRDAIVMRLAEIYLIKAECQLYTENGTAAMTTINELRAKRAISGTDNTLSGTATLETVLEERAVELCGEQQRWFDLKRTHTLIDHVKAYNAQASGNIQTYHYYRPIPQAQIDAVTNYSVTEGVGFWQNPGY
jgi:starch-binding outer membrane protein, SusD/RagB family